MKGTKNQIFLLNGQIIMIWLPKFGVWYNTRLTIMTAWDKDLSDFEIEVIVGAQMAGASLRKTAWMAQKSD